MSSETQWEPFMEALGQSVVVGAKRHRGVLSDEVMTIRTVSPTRRNVDRAWRKAEEWCERANAALDLVNRESEETR